MDSDRPDAGSIVYRLLTYAAIFLITGYLGVHVFHQTWTHQTILFAILIALFTIRRRRSRA